MANSFLKRVFLETSFFQLTGTITRERVVRFRSTWSYFVPWTMYCASASQKSVPAHIMGVANFETWKKWPKNTFFSLNWPHLVIFWVRKKNLRHRTENYFYFHNLFGFCNLDHLEGRYRARKRKPQFFLKRRPAENWAKKEKIKNHFLVKARIL